MLLYVLIEKFDLLSQDESAEKWLLIFTVFNQPKKHDTPAPAMAIKHRAALRLSLTSKIFRESVDNENLSTKRSSVTERFMRQNGRYFTADKRQCSREQKITYAP
jgi:hypothetical protein